MSGDGDDEDLPYGADAGNGHPSTIYEDHRISRREARAYASLLEEEIGEVRERLADSYPRMVEQLEDIGGEAEELLQSARDAVEDGDEYETVVHVYAPQIEQLRSRAEDVMRVDGDNAVKQVQRKRYQWMRWSQIIENHDRGSVNAQEYSMQTNTVREQFRKMDIELDRLQASYLGQQAFVDYLESIRNQLPRYLERGQDERAVEWTAEELDAHLDDTDAVAALEGIDSLDDTDDEPPATT